MKLVITSKKTAKGIECNAWVKAKKTSMEEVFKLPAVMGGTFGKILKDLETKHPSISEVEEASDEMAKDFKKGFISMFYGKEER